MTQTKILTLLVITRIVRKEDQNDITRYNTYESQHYVL